MNSSRNDEQRTAALLIAHGSRRAEANAELNTVAEAVRKEGGCDIVETAYLEIAEPTIPQGGEACVQQNATRVLMLPYFLSAGSHVVDDLERHRGELAKRFPDVEWVLCPPLGLHPLMTQIVLDRLREGDASAE